MLIDQIPARNNKQGSLGCGGRRSHFIIIIIVIFNFYSFILFLGKIYPKLTIRHYHTPKKTEIKVYRKKIYRNVVCSMTNVMFSFSKQKAPVRRSLRIKKARDKDGL